MKSVILFSGGWDSMAVALLKMEERPTLLFINYGQSYLRNELIYATKFAEHFGLTFHIEIIKLKHDQERRNYYLLMEAKRLGYKNIYTGNRNLIPLFDKYKDSNFLTLKLFSYLINIKLSLPILMWNKKKIVNYVLNNYKFGAYNCYNNKTDYKTCDCFNCKELRTIL